MSMRVRMWLRQEWDYQIRKHGRAETDVQRQRIRTFGQDDDWFRHALDQYYHRAEVLGLDTPVGRQALAKFVATGVGMLDSVIEEHGHLPPPGTPSGVDQ
ncbi:hypothetical protein LCGC14_3061830 [marine sediment metagenome]|uniref:Uncharacterized protein n=1 Tax=marine sediment metagenome TaxID=412755 RepID=A0A0F8WJ74_9ZZZZ